VEFEAKKAARRFFKRYGRGGLAAGELLESIREYLNKRFRLSYGSLTPAEAYKILRDGGIGAATAEKLHDLVQRCENAVYSGKGDAGVVTEEDPVHLIKKIEKQCRRR
jgi:hypothetical protein